MTSSFGDQPSPMMTSASNVGEGWHPILRELEEELNKIDPDFILQQVKEKFGGLRYYAQSHIADPSFQQAIHAAEAKSERTCEVCGEPGEVKATYHWLKCLCETHRAEDEKRYRKEGFI
jgi:hypothetical protein